MEDIVKRIHNLARSSGAPERGVRRLLAEICGISAAAVGDWYNGKTKRIRQEHLTAIARHFGTTVDYILTGKPPASRQAQISDKDLELMDDQSLWDLDARITRVLRERSKQS